MRAMELAALANVLNAVREHSSGRLQPAIKIQNEKGTPMVAVLYRVPLELYVLGLFSKVRTGSGNT